MGLLLVGSTLRRTMPSTMDRRPFAARRETFGLDTRKPWALNTLRLLFNVPRAYAPLVDAWDRRHPGTRRTLDRLVELGFVAHQGPVIVDTRTGRLAAVASRRVTRYRCTSKGARLTAAVVEDSRVLEDEFPRTAGVNTTGIIRLLQAFNLQDSHAKFGLSAQHAGQLSGLPHSNVKWWIRRLVAGGYLKELPEKLADVREVIPAHWRVTRALVRQLAEVIDAFDTAPASLKVEFRLGRSRFLADIDPARIGISGATDYDHDIECQRILGALLTSPKCASDAIFAVEPRFLLALDTTARPWTFHHDAVGSLPYQPDAELRERDSDGVRRAVLEYERFQSRRDAWNHIERFLGHLSLTTLPFEAAVLRFVVDSKPRERGYVELIEAFCDYALDHPDRMPPNPVTLAVSSTPRVLAAADPLDARAWFRIALPTGGSDTARRPVLHPAEASPYDEYFART